MPTPPEKRSPATETTRGSQGEFPNEWLLCQVCSRPATGRATGYIEGFTKDIEVSTLLCSSESCWAGFDPWPGYKRGGGYANE